MHVPLLVVGGGIAGLAVAHKSNQPCLVLEGADRLGGRAFTARDKRGRPLYDAGAWRVHSSHHRLIALCRALEVPLQFFEGDPPKQTAQGDWARGLSKLDVEILAHDGHALKALAADLKTGYAGTKSAAAGTHPYDAAERGEYYVVPDGFDAIATKLAAALPKSAEVALNTTVVDVVRADCGYTVNALHRPDPAQPCVRVTFTCAALVAAVPPRTIAKWTVAKRMLPVLTSVQEHPLHHIYAKYKTPPSKPQLAAKRRGVLSAIAQQIKPALDQAWYQASYSAGAIADFWNRVKLARGMPSVKALISRWGRRDVTKCSSHYWSCGYHAWRPVPFFDEQRAVRFSAEPNPIFLPRLYVCGEAFSSYQGWSEGALQTATLVSELLRRPVGSDVIIETPAPHHMVLDGRVLDAVAWAKTHPGSRVAIENHLGEDITMLFRHVVQHSDLSWAVVFALQVGFTRRRRGD